jgi:hypothetical protein
VSTCHNILEGSTASIFRVEKEATWEKMFRDVEKREQGLELNLNQWKQS